MEEFGVAGISVVVGPLVTAIGTLFCLYIKNQREQLERAIASSSEVHSKFMKLCGIMLKIISLPACTVPPEIIVEVQEIMK